MSIVNDSVAGTNVLSVATTTSEPSGPKLSTINNQTFPIHQYAEVVARYDNLGAWPGHSGVLVYDLWTYNPGQTSGVTFTFIEQDYIEVGSDNGAAFDGGQEIYSNAGINQPFAGGGGGPTNGPVSGIDFTQYNTTGFRMTGDSSGNVASCMYVNGGFPAGFVAKGMNQCGSVVQFKCNTQNSSNCGGQVNNPTQYDRVMGVIWGSQATVVPAVTSHLFVQRFTIWECADWRDTNNTTTRNDFGAAHQCFGTPLTTP